MPDPASTGLGYHFNLRIRNSKLPYVGTRNVAIYAFFWGKFLYVRVYACVKDLKNIMSGMRAMEVTIIVTIYRVIFFTGTSQFQYQKENRQAADHGLS